MLWVTQNFLIGITRDESVVTPPEFLDDIDPKELPQVLGVGLRTKDFFKKLFVLFLNSRHWRSFLSFFWVMDQSNEDKLIYGVRFVIKSVALLIGAEELLGLLS